MASKHKSDPKILAPRNSILFWIAIFTLALGVTFVVTYHFIHVSSAAPMFPMEAGGQMASLHPDVAPAPVTAQHPQR